MAKKDEAKMAAAILTASISKRVMKNVPIGKLPDARSAYIMTSLVSG